MIFRPKKLLGDDGPRGQQYTDLVTNRSPKCLFSVFCRIPSEKGSVFGM
jgi:hypothetical protein